MKKCLFPFLFFFLFLLCACSNDSPEQFEEYVDRLDRISGRDLMTIFSEKREMDQLIVGKSTSIIESDRFKEDSDFGFYSANDFRFDGYEATVSISYESGKIDGTSYAFYSIGLDTAKGIMDDCCKHFGDPFYTTEEDDTICYAWSEEGQEDLILLYSTKYDFLSFS